MKDSLTPITRTISVSKKINGISLSKEKDTVDVYKNGRKVVSMKIKDLEAMLKQIHP